jgi:hypothetical protein
MWKCIIVDRGNDVAPQDFHALNEEVELREEIGVCITRLFRITSVVRRVVVTDPFAKRSEERAIASMINSTSLSSVTSTQRLQLLQGSGIKTAWEVLLLSADRI